MPEPRACELRPERLNAPLRPPRQMDVELHQVGRLFAEREAALDALESLVVGAESDPRAEHERLLVRREHIENAVRVLRRAGRLR